MTQPTVDQAYLAKRQLRKGTAGWMLLAGLGVSYVISGDFAGWNFGIAEAGWGGLGVRRCCGSGCHARGWGGTGGNAPSPGWFGRGRCDRAARLSPGIRRRPFAYFGASRMDG